MTDIPPRYFRNRFPILFAHYIKEQVKEQVICMNNHLRQAAQNKSFFVILLWQHIRKEGIWWIWKINMTGFSNTCIFVFVTGMWRKIWHRKPSSVFWKAGHTVSFCRQTALELSGGACPLCRDYHNGAGDWAAEILRAAGRIKRRWTIMVSIRSIRWTHAAASHWTLWHRRFLDTRFITSINLIGAP